MSDIAIRVENLSKQYRLGTQASYHRFSEVLSGMGRAAVGTCKHWLTWAGKGAAAGSTAGRGEFWALKDVSFDVRQGEVVGIIGRNGAGKSTLLKILSRVTEPTTGRFGVRGCVGSLLEVGTGFHPELTGRENIFLNGSVLGMSRAEIRKKQDEIIAFAGTESFLDTPVKRYSSGMQMRLGFAVAAHLQPEILIVDEVLAVGDIEFQKRCLGKMEEVARSGRTVLFVSHNIDALTKLCNRAILLKEGRSVQMDVVQEVVRQYVEGLTQQKLRYVNTSTAGQDDRVAILTYASIYSDDGSIDEVIRADRAMRLDLTMWNPLPGAILNFSVNFWNDRGLLLFNTASPPVRIDRGTMTARLLIPPDLFNTGHHSVEVMIVAGRLDIIGDVMDAVTFYVTDMADGDTAYQPRTGVVRPRVQWSAREGGNSV